MSKPVVLTRKQSRMVDVVAIEKYGITGLELMETAGRKTAELIERLGINGPVVICCGNGNNAGDGFVIARHLVSHGHVVETIMLSEPDRLPPDARTNYDLLLKNGHVVRKWSDVADHLDAMLRNADWTVDALLGTGAVGPPREPYGEIIRTINRLAKRTFAVDVPSGLDVDSGEANEPTVMAHHTGTFVSLKQGYLNPTAGKWLGEIHLIDIGIPEGVIDEICN